MSAVISRFASLLDGLRQGAFNGISILTGTGYASMDFEIWGPFTTPFFLVLMFIGGCSASTSCGIKIFRFQILFQELKQQAAQIVLPNAVIIKRFNRRPLADDIVAAVMAFFLLYIGSALVLAVLFFARDPTAVGALDVAPGVLWITFTFAAMLGLNPTGTSGSYFRTVPVTRALARVSGASRNPPMPRPRARHTPSAPRSASPPRRRMAAAVRSTSSPSSRCFGWMPTPQLPSAGAYGLS